MELNSDRLLRPLGWRVHSWEHQKASLVSKRVLMWFSLSLTTFSITMNSKSDIKCSTLLKCTANSHMVLFVNIADLWFRNLTLNSLDVETKVGKCFLQLIDQHFPKSNPLHKIVNRNTVKLSYSCMNNVKSIISSHNIAQINKPSKQSDQIDNSCNCRNNNNNNNNIYLNTIKITAELMWSCI